MTDRPGEHHEPSASLALCKPLLHELSEGTTVFRFHGGNREPLFFGRTGSNRFDSPDNSFGSLYVAMDEYGAFIETFGSATGIAAVTGAMIDERSLAEITLQQPLRLIDLASRGGLPRIRADGRLLTGSHAIAQRWAAALREHPTSPNGILYLARHDPARKVCVLFDDLAATFKVVSRGSLRGPANRVLLGAILRDYDFGLIE